MVPLIFLLALLVPPSLSFLSPPPPLPSPSLPAFRTSTPSQASCESLGVRDWPQSSFSSSLSDPCKPGALRYVLSGEGAVGDEETEESFGVGTLVEVEDGSVLRWTAGKGEEVVLLTPEYRGLPVPAIAAGFLLLIAGTVALSRLV
jgi:hypothetical protein